MIRRAPAEVFVRYLLCHPDRYPNEVIQERMEELRLYCPKLKQLDALRKKHKPPEPFFPQDRDHTESLQFLRDTGIFSFFYPDSSTEFALKILESPRAKSMVEQQLAQRAPTRFIVAGLEKRLQLECSEAGIEKYRYFFFNEEICPRGDMLQAALILATTWARGGADNDITPANVAAEKLAMAHDPLVTALRLPTCSQAQVFIAIQGGYLPKETQYDLAQSLRELAFLMVNQATLKVIDDGPHAARDAKDCLVGVQIIQEMLANMHSPGEAARTELERDLRLVSDENKPKTLKSLSQGNCTIDLQPLGKADAVGAAWGDDED